MDSEIKAWVDACLEGLGERVDKVMKTLGPKETSTLSGVSKSYLYKLIGNKSVPTIDKTLAIAKAGNVNLEWLATGEGMADIGKSFTLETACDLLKELIDTAKKEGIDIDMNKIPSLLSAAESARHATEDDAMFHTMLKNMLELSKV